MRSFAPLVALLVVAPLLLGGCARFGPGCALTIAAIPTGAGGVEGQRLPSNSVILASPADFDPKHASWGRDANGAPTVSVQMWPEATTRTASYTADNIGVPMAIAIDKTIFIVAPITAQIPDGALTVVPENADQAVRLPKLFEGCVSHPYLPSASPGTSPTPSASP